MDKKKYIKWYNVAKEVINDFNLIPDRTDDEILIFISSEDWLMFAPKSIITKKDGESMDIPNIYLDLHRDLEGEKEARIVPFLWQRSKR